MVLVQNWPFFQLSFFCQYTPAKYVLLCSRTKKRLSWLKKRRSSENPKIQIFSNGLVRGLGPQFAIFRTYLFKAIKARKIWYIIFYNEKTIF